MKELKLKIEGMVCGGCENRVTVKSKEDLDISQIKEKIIDIGYEIVEG